MRVPKSAHLRPRLRGVPLALHIGWPVVATEAVLLGTSVYVVAACNGPLWKALLVGRPHDSPYTWAFLLAVITSCAAATFVMLAALSQCCKTCCLLKSALLPVAVIWSLPLARLKPTRALAHRLLAIVGGAVIGWSPMRIRRTVSSNDEYA
jgi:hypothetical protein